jgi:hypothetical protein
MREVDDAEKQGGLCEGEGKRVGGHFCESNSWLAAGSGDYMRLVDVGCPDVGSDLIGLSGVPLSGGVRGMESPASFSRLAVPRLCLHVPRTPLDRTHSSILPHPSPFSHLFCLCRITLLVSSPAGRSFFEKTTRARTRPTPLPQKSRSLPHPNRRYSSTFVCIFPSSHPHTRSPFAKCSLFVLFFKFPS